MSEKMSDEDLVELNKLAITNRVACEAFHEIRRLRAVVEPLEKLLETPGAVGVTIDHCRRDEGYGVEVIWGGDAPSHFSGVTLAQALAAAVEGVGK